MARTLEVEIKHRISYYHDLLAVAPVVFADADSPFGAQENAYGQERGCAVDGVGTAEEGFEEERQSTLSGLLSSKLVPVDVFEGTYVEFEVKCKFKGGLECEAGATVFHQKRSRSECRSRSAMLRAAKSRRGRPKDPPRSP